MNNSNENLQSGIPPEIQRKILRSTMNRWFAGFLEWKIAYRKTKTINIHIILYSI